MWPFKQRKTNVLSEAIRHLRTDNWGEARHLFQTAESDLETLPKSQQVQVLLDSAICHLAKRSNGKAKENCARARQLAAPGTNAAKFAIVLEKACDKDFFADPLMVPPTGEGDFDLANIVPAEVSFLKHSFLQLVVDS